MSSRALKAFAIAAVVISGFVPNVLIHNRVQRILSDPRDAAALHVVPETRRILDEETSSGSHRYDLGYATFAADPGSRLSSRTHSGGKTSVMVKSERMSFGFLPPDEDGKDEYGATLRDLDRLSRGTFRTWLMETIGTNPPAKTVPRASVVDLHLAMVNVRPLSLWELLQLSRSQAAAYFIRIMDKSLLSGGGMSGTLQRIIPFESAGLLGLVYVNNGGKNGKIELANHERTITQSIMFWAPDASEYPAAAVETVLSSYRFTIPAAVDAAEIAERVANAGIVASTTAEEGCSSGTGKEH